MTTVSHPSNEAELRASVRRAFVLMNLGVTGFLIGLIYLHVAGNRMAPWILGRATGICGYLLLDSLVVVGMVLSSPHHTRRSGRTPARIRLHISLALFTIAVIALHVVVLATDRYAGVGWWGAVLPVHSQYRPAATTLGVLGMWMLALAAATAGAAGHVPRRAWWPLHKIALVTFVLVWLHGVLGGSDAAALRWLYAATGIATLAVALWRYWPTAEERAR